MSDRYKPNGAPLTEREREILIILMEECAEVIQAASKLLRFGKDNRPSSGVSNIYALSAEYGDLYIMAGMAEDAGLIRQTAVQEGMERKRQRLAKYMQSENHAEGEKP